MKYTLYIYYTVRDVYTLWKTVSRTDAVILHVYIYVLYNIIAKVIYSWYVAYYYIMLLLHIIMYVYYIVTIIPAAELSKYVK